MDTDMTMIAPYAFHKEITTLPIIVLQTLLLPSRARTKKLSAIAATKEKILYSYFHVYFAILTLLKIDD